MAALYWRLDFELPAAGNIEIYEIEMRATNGGADQCNGGTASASSAVGTRPASNAFDNNTTSTARWVSNNAATTSHWIRYQFATPVEVVEFALWPAAIGTIPAGTTVKLSYSNDGTNWTVAMVPKRMVSHWVTAGYHVFRTVGADTKSYWRINFSEAQSGVSVNVVEMELHSAIGGADLTNVDSVIAANNYIVTNDPYRGFDNSDSTHWVSSSLPAFLGQRFVADTDIVEYVLRAGAITYEPPRAWVLEYSGDGITWTVADTRSGEPDWPIIESRTYLVGGGGAAVAGNIKPPPWQRGSIRGNSYLGPRG